jgi:fructose-1,6-bisphosphatase/sedoheptulose 1,7-bisphosphatase-like protein
MIVRGRTAIILIVLLVVSLALNFFAGGVIVAGMRAQRVLAGFDRTRAAFMERLPAELQRAVAMDVVSQRERIFTALEELRRARGEMFAAMKAVPFDRARLDRAMAEVRAKTQALQSVGQAALAAAVAAATPETRAKIKAPD